MTAIMDYLTDFRILIGDDVSPNYYEDSTLANAFFVGAREFNSHATQQVSISGTGSGAQLSPDSVLADPHLPILLLYWQKAILQRENSENSRRGYSVSNVAGRIDGRERYLSARDQLREVVATIADLETLRNRRSYEGDMAATDIGRSELETDDESELGG